MRIALLAAALPAAAPPLAQAAPADRDAIVREPKGRILARGGRNLWRAGPLPFPTGQ